MTARASMDSARARILAVDDEAMNLELIQRSLRRRYEVLTATSADEALALLQSEPDVSVILSDFRMPGKSGADLLAAAMDTHPDTKRVIITGYADTDALGEAVGAGRVHYVLKKPWKHQELHQLLEQLVDAYHLSRENRKLARSLHQVSQELRIKEEALEYTESVQADTDTQEALSSAGTEVIPYRDSLTGLYSSHAFQERLREEVARSLRHGQPVSLLLGDLDGFATINKALGYREADGVLRQVARLMTHEPGTRVRDSDVVARYGGEEFALLLPETGKHGAIIKANRLREAVARVTLAGGRRITISFGITTVPDDTSTAQDMLRCAEAALRAAKQAGGNNIHVFGDTRDMQESGYEGTTITPIGEGMHRTYHECVGEIATLLKRQGTVSCVYVDCSWLRRIEPEIGPVHHADMYDRAGMALEDLAASVLGYDALVCRAEDAYVGVLRQGNKRDLRAQVDSLANGGLARLAVQVEGRLNHMLGPDVRALMRDQPRLVVGHARVLDNALVRPEELISRLIDEARSMAELRRQRAVLRDKALLQEIILGNALAPVYQPIVALGSGEVLGYESLARGPRQSPLESPTTLFAIADEVGLTFELDRACFGAALKHADGIAPEHRLFVNLQPLSFYDTAHIEGAIAAFTQATGLGPSNLVFEVSERLALRSFSEFRRAVTAYASRGYGIAIDDVGTRHADLETIVSVRPNFIKASEVITRGAARSTVKRELLRSLVQIAGLAGAAVIAEGIEDADDLSLLRDLGISYGQGFILARPAAPFARLRASVRRSLANLPDSPREPIPALPADEPVDGPTNATGEVLEPAPNVTLKHAEHAAIAGGAVGNERPPVAALTSGAEQNPHDDGDAIR